MSRLATGFWILVFIWSLLLGNWCFAATAVDSSYLAVGARALGMGKAYAAAADDGDTIFTNPAGLGQIDYFKAASMSGKLFEDVNYSLLGGAYPLGQKMAIGLGAVLVSVPGVDLRDASGTLLRQTSYSSALLLASFGKEVADNLSLGLNLKYFATTNADEPDGNGAGGNLDLGLLHTPSSFFSWGAVVQNILSSSRINYQNADTDQFPLVLKLGTKFYLTGARPGAAREAPVETSLYSDVDFQLKGNLPLAGHLGLEVSPNQYLTFRGGLDQLSNGGWVQTCLTGGLGLKFGGLAFNYAYHPFGETGESGAHYFSLNYDERLRPLEPPAPDVFQALAKPAVL